MDNFKVIDAQQKKALRVADRISEDDIFVFNEICRSIVFNIYVFYIVHLVSTKSEYIDPETRGVDNFKIIPAYLVARIGGPRSLFIAEAMLSW